MKKVIYCLLVAFFTTVFNFSSSAGIITLSGVYLGKNIYVQNTLTVNLKSFCTNDVYINDVKSTMDVNATAFEIDLSHLKLNAPVTIKITYKNDCKPQILNPYVIKAGISFQFNSFTVDNAAILWTTKGERPKGKFVIEQQVNKVWVLLSEVPNKGSLVMNDYTFKMAHKQGLNVYRVKYVEADGQVYLTMDKLFKYPN